MKKLPIFDAFVDADDLGIVAVSLVDMPATESDWICFSKDEFEQFTVVNEEEHILSGVLMVCNKPIYRRKDEYEYYIRYSAETIKLMAEKMLADNAQNNIDIQHDGNILEKGTAQLVELYIVDDTKGIKPNFIDVPNGSLVGSYKIHNEELWNMCKNGQLNGFSVAGYFNIEPTEEMFSKINKDNTSNMNLKTILTRLMVKFSDVTLEDGTVWLFDGELAEGTNVSLEDGNPVEDGEYVVDGKKVVIESGAVKSIETSEPEPEPKPQANAADTEPEPAKTEESDVVSEPEPATDEPNVKAEVDALKADLEAIKAELESLKSTIAEIATKPAAEPVVEEYEKQTTKPDNKASRMLGYIK